MSVQRIFASSSAHWLVSLKFEAGEDNAELIPAFTGADTRICCVGKQSGSESCKFRQCITPVYSHGGIK
jgi:hypothetical protein